jgi:DNA-binding transcriptional LysR family regulator
MTDIDKDHIRRLDGLLLLVFQGLMRQRKATLVAEHLGLTQSSVSHALNRLREVFGDPLFVRRPHGLAPTAAAQNLAPHIDAALDALNAACSGAAHFDPALSDRTLRLGAYDYALSTLAPALIAHMRRHAPAMRLSAQAVGRRDALAALMHDEIDLAIGYFWALPEAYAAQPLFEETYLVAGPPEHPFFKRGGDRLKRFLAADHIVTSPQGDLVGIVDKALARQGLARRVIVAAPLFLPALAMAQSAGALVTAPKRLVAAHAARFGLAAAPAPLAVRPFQVSAVHCRRDAQDPFRAWAVQALAAVCGARDTSARARIRAS